MVDLTLLEFYRNHCAINGKPPVIRDSDVAFFKLVEKADKKKKRIALLKSKLKT